MKQFIKNNRAILTVCLVFVAFSFGAFVTTQNRNEAIQKLTDETIQREYENSLLGCERGNDLREQIFSAVSIAADNSVNGQESYEKIIDNITSAPTADPNTGRLDCKNPIITKPPSERD